MKNHHSRARNHLIPGNSPGFPGHLFLLPGPSGTHCTDTIAWVKSNPPAGTLKDIHSVACPKIAGEIASS